MTPRRHTREAAAILRRLLDAVDAGELAAGGPLGANVIRQLRGAVAALDAVAAPEPPCTEDNEGR